MSSISATCQSYFPKDTWDGRRRVKDWLKTYCGSGDGKDNVRVAEVNEVVGKEILSYAVKKFMKIDDVCKPNFIPLFYGCADEAFAKFLRILSTGDSVKKEEEEDSATYKTLAGHYAKLNRLLSDSKDNLFPWDWKEKFSYYTREMYESLVTIQAEKNTAFHYSRLQEINLGHLLPFTSVSVRNGRGTLNFFDSLIDLRSNNKLFLLFAGDFEFTFCRDMPSFVKLIFISPYFDGVRLKEDIGQLFAEVIHDKLILEG